MVIEDGFELRSFRREFPEFKPAPFLGGKVKFDTSAMAATVK